MLEVRVREYFLFKRFFLFWSAIHLGLRERGREGGNIKKELTIYHVYTFPISWRHKEMQVHFN